MKICEEHRHEHRQLPCPWPDCPNSEGASGTIEAPRHSGAGRMTRAEGHFDVSPAPRVFERKGWKCEACGTSGWVWLERGAEIRVNRCPHRRVARVQPLART